MYQNAFGKKILRQADQAVWYIWPSKCHQATQVFHKVG